MATQVTMPQLGETVVEGTITRWLKQEGESIEVDEPLLEVSTDKVDSEIPAPAGGKVVKIHIQEGETVKVGTLLAEIAADGQAAAPAAEEPKDEPAPPPAEEPKKEVAAAPAPPREREERKEAPKPAAARAEVSATEQEPRRGILSPLVRKLAAEHRVDLEMIKGTGTGGRITKQDVLAFVSSGAATAPSRPAAEAVPAGQAIPTPAKVAAGGQEVVPVGHMRKAIAEHMVQSHLATARAWNTVEVDLTRVASLRADAGDAFKEREGFSLTWMPFVAKAICQALLKFPQVNSTWNDDGTITRKYFVNLGIAVALPNGLIVPVLKGADGMNISGLARGIRDIATRARNKKLSPDEVQDGTFTITNPGPFGSIISVPIINRGQAGILAVDAVTKRPVVVTDEFGNDSIAIRQMVFISMSWDHRVIDGAEAAQFLGETKRLLEEGEFESDLTPYLSEKS